MTRPTKNPQVEEFIENMIEFANQANIKADDPTIDPYIIDMVRSNNKIPLGPPNYDCNSENATYEEGWAEVLRYINIEKGHNVKYWEPMNEPYGTKSVGEIICIANTYAQRMKEVDPSIRIMVPLYEPLVDEALSLIDPDLIDDVQFHQYALVYVPDYQAGYIGCTYNIDQQFDTNYVLENLYPDLVGGRIEEARGVFEFYRNKLDVNFPGYKKEAHVTEWNDHIQIVETQAGGYGDLNIPQYCFALDKFINTLMGSISRASYKNMMLKEG